MRVILLFVVLSNLLLGIFVLTQDHKSSNNQLFSLMSFLAAIWSFANYMTSIFPSLTWFQTSYAVGSLVISAGLIWVLVITGGNVNFWKISGISLIAIFFSINSFVPGFIAKSDQNLDIAITNLSSVGWGMGLYCIYYFITSIVIIYRLYLFQKKSQNKEKKYQSRYILVGASITLITTAFTSFVFPYLSIFTSGAIDNIGFLFFLILVTYSISKHHLFDIKVIIIELTTFALWIFMLIRIILARDLHDMLVESVLFFVVVALGILLIQNVLQGIRQRKDIDDLVKNLEETRSILERKTLLDKLE